MSAYEYKPTIRTETLLVNPDHRKTSEQMTKFEYTEILSHRAKQIEDGGPIFVDAHDLTDPLDIARREIHQGKCPLSIVRAITDKISEKWDVNEMVVPDF